MLNIAHRGASGEFPENTLAAFAAAIKSGAGMCELDVQLARDGAVVVIHDDTVDRTTNGRGAVAKMTLAELRALDAGGPLGGPAFAGERIPTLAEVASLTRGRCALNIEIKAATALIPTCEILRDEGMLDSALLSSFDWATLESARRISQSLRLGVLADRAPDRMLQSAANLRAAAVNPRHDLAGLRLCKRAHQMGLQVYTWTVDRPALMRRLYGNGVDGIMTNYPGRLAALDLH